MLASASAFYGNDDSAYSHMHVHGCFICMGMAVYGCHQPAGMYDA
jgi:hypothetical protein